MWPLSELMTVNLLTSLLGSFFQADYTSNIVIQSNIKVIDRRVTSKSFEFSPEIMELAIDLAQNKFPKNFLFGAASSAYQIEGAYNSPEKGNSVWDHWTHQQPDIVRDRSNGDVACNSFVKYEEDIGLVKNLGANVYQISLSWSRILPTGMTDFISLEGIRYYNEMINKMIQNGITPLVVIHHFDIPLKLQMIGGWTNPNMVIYFEKFARIAFNYFGDRVKKWITIHDPFELCNVQFGNSLRPVYNDTGIGNYLCGHHVLLAHAKVYRAYRNEFHWLQKGKVGITVSTRWFEPEEYTSVEDTEATEISFQFSNYWFLHPLLANDGDYPPIMRFEIDLKSSLQYFEESRLPTFSKEEISMIRGSLDFLGLSFYTTYTVRAIREDPELYYSYNNFAHTETLKRDMSAKWLIYDDAFGAFDIKNTAENFGKLLHRLNNDYVLPQIYITGNGYADFGEKYDVDRSIYLHDHLAELLKSMKSGVDIRGYIIWSLMDSFEWKDGYSKRFGLYQVDFNDKNRIRKEKLSTSIIKDIFQSRTVSSILMIASAA